MSSDIRNIPCSEWAEKLAALHPDDLAPTEQDTLSAHLASCSGCAQTYRDYHHLANLVRDLSNAEIPADLLPGLPGLTDEQGALGIEDIPVAQPGITFSRPTRIPERRSWKVPGIAFAAVAAVLVANVLLGNFALRVQPAVLSRLSQGPEPVYYLTPQGGPSKLPTPQENPGGPMILTNPTPPFFVDGNVYRNSIMYRADTGAPVQRYLKNLGDVMIYNPRFVDGILYMAVRMPDFHGPMVMYALRASDGAVLWKWDNCGESDNMSSPTITNGVAYFICEATPNLYKLYALQARTGTLLWVNTLPGEIALDLLVNKHMLYIHQGNQLLAESADTGKLLWQRSFGGSDDYIEYAASVNGVIYIAQEKAFFALQASDGKSVWEYHFSGGYYGPVPYVDQGVVYLFVWQMNGPRTIYALDGMTGVLHWQKQLSNANSFPTIDHGNLYMVMDVFARPSQAYSAPIKRMLVAIRGSDGRTLWQQDIPWNKGKLTYATIEPPQVTVGGGRIYLVDWQSANIQNLKATMGAFSESNGALLWTRDVSQN